MGSTAVTLLNSSVVEFLLSMREVPSSVLVKVYFLFAGPHLLQLQHLLAAVHGTLIFCWADYTFFFMWSIKVYAVLQCSTE